MERRLSLYTMRYAERRLSHYIRCGVLHTRENGVREPRSAWITVFHVGASTRTWRGVAQQPLRLSQASPRGFSCLTCWCEYTDVARSRPTAVAVVAGKPSWVLLSYACNAPVCSPLCAGSVCLCGGNVYIFPAHL